jgi:hypothetical protein
MLWSAHVEEGAYVFSLFQPLSGHYVLVCVCIYFAPFH